jgi:hypothetical protein
MSTSFLYHALGLTGYHYLSMRFKKGKVFFLFDLLAKFPAMQ